MTNKRWLVSAKISKSLECTVDSSWILSGSRMTGEQALARVPGDSITYSFNKTR